MLYTSLVFATLTHALSTQALSHVDLDFSTPKRWRKEFENELHVLQSNLRVNGHRIQDGVVYWEMEYARRDPNNPLGPSRPHYHVEQRAYAPNEATMCPQPQAANDTRMSHRECLVTSVYVPDSNSSSSSGGGLRPIIVLFHPGANTYGDHALWGVGEPMAFAKQQNAIVVTFNHRLGLDGFLMEQSSLDDNQMQAALSDQRNLLIWIKTFGGAFGGEVTNITAMGSSAGASALVANMTSGVRYIDGTDAQFIVECEEDGHTYDSINGKCDRALFHKAWIMSSVDTEHMFMDETRAETYYRMFGLNTKYDCFRLDDNSFNRDFMNCMRNKYYQNQLLEDKNCTGTGCFSMNEIDRLYGRKAHEHLSAIRHVMPFPYAFGTGQFLKKSPIDAILTDKWWQIPTVFGMMKDEESIFRDHMRDEVNEYWGKINADSNAGINTSTWDALKKLLRYSFTWDSLDTQDSNNVTLEQQVINKYVADLPNASHDDRAGQLMRESLFYCKKYELIEAIYAQNNSAELFHYTIEETFQSANYSDPDTNTKIGSFHFADYLFMLKAFENDATSTSTLTEIAGQWFNLATYSFVDQWKLALEYMLKEEFASIDTLELHSEMVPVGNRLRDSMKEFIDSATGTVASMTSAMNDSSYPGILTKNVYTPADTTVPGSDPSWTRVSADSGSLDAEEVKLVALKARCGLLQQLEVPETTDRPTNEDWTFSTTTAPTTL